MPNLQSGSGIVLREDGSNLFIDGFEPVQAEFVVFVSKSGDNSNDGSSPEKAKLTIASGLTAAQAILDANGETGCYAVRIEIAGAGRYEENIVVQSNMILIGLAATIVGQIEIQTRARVIIYAHYASQSNQIMLLKTGTNGAWYTTFISDGRGCDGLLTGTTNAKSETTDSILFVEAGLMLVAENGTGIEDSASGFGHNHFSIKDLYLAGNNAEGLRFVGGQSDGVGYLDHILEIGTPTGTVGIEVGNNSLARIISCEIVSDTAWTVAANGDLYLICPRVVGTTSGSLSNS